MTECIKYMAASWESFFGRSMHYYEVYLAPIFHRFKDQNSKNIQKASNITRDVTLLAWGRWSRRRCRQRSPRRRRRRGRQRGGRLVVVVMGVHSVQNRVSRPARKCFDVDIINLEIRFQGRHSDLPQLCPKLSLRGPCYPLMTQERLPEKFGWNHNQPYKWLPHNACPVEWA